MASRGEPHLLSLFARFDDLGLPFERHAPESGDPDPSITDVVFDSRRVAPGALFCCVPGHSHDGHDFALAAVQSGAAALLVERLLPVDVAQVVVGSVRQSMARVAAAFFDHPSEQLPVVGVTGTNGKTTVAALLASIADAQGWSATVIGTLGGVRTTPESPELQRLLANSVARGDDVVAMEVSSHSLAQARVEGTHFRVSVFTNLTEDHLDYHHTMDQYFEAKAALFEPERTDIALINVDDPYGRRLLDSIEVPARPYGSADVEIHEETSTHTRFVWRERRVDLPLAGRFNVLNALAAAEAALELGVDPDRIVSGLGTVGPIPGRFEVLADEPFTVVVDYAHTPDGLRQVLAAARPLAAGARVIVVFGAGGDRDHEKRPLMGAAAEAGADVVVVTNDNPRSERPAMIIEAVLAGVSSGTAPIVIEDRAEAIRFALGEAEPGDIVVIAGKGHETTQTIGDRVLDFDDRIVARAALAELPS